MPGNVMIMDRKCSYSYIKISIKLHNILIISTFTFGTVLVMYSTERITTTYGIRKRTWKDINH
jgi:preprotein translocase subunit SecY